MTRDSEVERHSRPVPLELPKDSEQRAALEARNALRQFDGVRKLIGDALAAPNRFRLRPSHLLELNRLATEGVNPLAGVYRPHGVTITNSAHSPPPQENVAMLVEDMCDYVNERWDASSVHLAAYLMWRINWIHPFHDGNGRTARAASYAVMCIRMGYHLPGAKTIPDQIVDGKTPYYDALEAADANYAEGRVDVSAMERLLEDLLATQLLAIHHDATTPKE